MLPFFTYLYHILLRETARVHHFDKETVSVNDIVNMPVVN